MKKLLSDTEITIVRDIIKLKRKRQLVDVMESTAVDPVMSTTTEEEGVDTEDAMTADSSTEVSEATAIDFFEKVTFLQ